jgi:hypothetical protein
MQSSADEVSFETEQIRVESDPMHAGCRVRFLSRHPLYRTSVTLSRSIKKIVAIRLRNFLQHRLIDATENELQKGGV